MKVRQHQYFYTYDSVGSFLRPDSLKTAYQQVAAGEISRDEFTEVELQAVQCLVQKEVGHGLRVVSDGVFNLQNFFLDFLAGLNGVEVVPNGFKLNLSGQELVADGLKLNGKLAYARDHPFFADFE